MGLFFETGLHIYAAWRGVRGTRSPQVVQPLPMRALHARSRQCVEGIGTQVRRRPLVSEHMQGTGEAKQEALATTTASSALVAVLPWQSQALLNLFDARSSGLFVERGTPGRALILPIGRSRRWPGLIRLLNIAPVAWWSLVLLARLPTGQARAWQQDALTAFEWTPSTRIP